MEPRVEPAAPRRRWSDPGDPEESPFRGPGTLVRVLPFAIVALVAEASLALQSGPVSAPDVTISLVLLLATAGAFLLPWSLLPGWVSVLVPLAYTGSVLALTLAAGIDSGVGLVILIPLVWTALFQRRWESGVTVAAIVAAEVVISVAQHAPDSVIARRIVLWTALGALISVATHGLRDRIQRSHGESARLQDRLRELSVLADRERIAGDLQDRVAQRLLAAGTALQGTALLARDGEVRRRLEATLGDLDDAVRLLRQAIFGLGRRAGHGNLRQGVLTICDGLAAVPEVVFTGPVDGALTTAAEAQLLQLLREAFSALGEQAVPSEVSVTAGDTLSVTVTATALALSLPARAHRAAPDFSALAEHAGQAGAIMDTQPVPGGLRLSWQFPLAAGHQQRPGAAARRAP